MLRGGPGLALVLLGVNSFALAPRLRRTPSSRVSWVFSLCAISGIESYPLLLVLCFLLSPDALGKPHGSSPAFPCLATSC